MEKLFRIHRAPESLDYKKIWKEGLFVFDSNVLLDLYRLPKTARVDLIGILQNEDFNKRIWIGFQVILEFLNNRYEAISDQKNKFNSVRTLIEDSIHNYETLFETLNNELNKLKLKQRHSLIDPEKFITNTNIQNGVQFLHDFIDDLTTLETKQSDVNDYDEIKDIVITTFTGKIGKSFDRKELLDLYKDGEKRYENQIPPGYKDNKKEGFYIYEDKDYVRKYGDLILWKEIIKKAKDEKLKYIVLVTGDVKEDWWFEKRGKKLGPRLELLNEIYSEAPDVDTFFMYDTSTFLKHAKNELKFKINDSSIKEAKDLIDLSRQKRYESEAGMVNILLFLKHIAIGFPTIRIGIGNSVKNLPLIKVDESILTLALVEIFSNVHKYSQDRYVGVQASEKPDSIHLRFKNLKSVDLPNDVAEGPFRGRGLEFIRSMLQKENIDFSYTEEGKRFVVELFIPLYTLPNI